MKKILILMFVATTAVFAANNKKSDSDNVWKPYKFKGTEHFKYVLTSKQKDNTVKGWYIIDISKADKKYRVKINGDFDGNEGNFSTKVDDVSGISGVIFAQMIFNPWLTPLTTTLFANTLIAMYTAGPFTGDLEEGSHWTYKSKHGGKVEFKVEGSCKYAGRKGKLLVMKKDGKTQYESCIDKDVALPIYVKYADDEGKYTSLELTEYKE